MGVQYNCKQKKSTLKAQNLLKWELACIKNKKNKIYVYDIISLIVTTLLKNSKCSNNNNNATKSTNYATKSTTYLRTKNYGCPHSR